MRKKEKTKKNYIYIIKQVYFNINVIFSVIPFLYLIILISS